jgi:hypothetical protein
VTRREWISFCARLKASRCQHIPSRSLTGSVRLP